MLNAQRVVSPVDPVRYGVTLVVHCAFFVKKFVYFYYIVGMDEEIYVSCHAPGLSLLLYETARGVHDQKGLLIGQICNEVISRKTDENEVNHEHKTAIYLEHCIPISDQDTFGSGGILNKTKLQNYVDILKNKIIGWYSFRRNCPLVPISLSEMLIHRSLLELLPFTKCQYFVACFMSSSTAANMSTHIFNHIFMTLDPTKDRFEPLRLKIYTLSDKSVNSNGYLMKNPFPTSSNFEKIINYVPKEETPVKSVFAIRERVGEVLKFIDKKLQTIESHRLQLEQEVQALKRKLQMVNDEEVLAIEPENEELTSKTVPFNPKIKYNTNRKTNPLKSVIMKPIVPAEIQKEKRNLEHTKSANVSAKPTPFGDPLKKPANSVLTNCDGGDAIVADSENKTPKILDPKVVHESKPMDF